MTNWNPPEHSESLNMRYSLNRVTGEVMTEDKVMYQKSEVDVLRDLDGPISIRAHNVKKVFNGVIFKVEKGGK